MEPGTKYCPNHPDLKFPPYKDECTVCNRTLDTYPGGKVAEAVIGEFPASLADHIFRTDGVEDQFNPYIDEPPEPDPIEHATKTVEKLKASIKEKIEAKKAHRKGKK